MQQKFIPSPTIERFMLSNARRRVIMGPFGSGKSSGCCVELPRRAQMQRTGPDGIRRSRFAVVRNTMPQLRDTTMKTWFDWFPNGTLGHYRETGKTYTMQFGDVISEVIFRALDDEDDVKNLLSLELTGAYINECREILQVIVDGLDGRIGRYPSVRNGGCSFPFLIADTNPPDEDSYWHRVIEGLDPSTGHPIVGGNGWDAYKQPSGLSPDAENLKYLPDGYYVNMAQGKTKDWIDVYVHGRYGKGKAGKPVHPLFNEELHVAKDLLIPNKHLKLVLGADFGLTPAIAFKQQDAFGRVLTLDEVVTEDMGLERALNLRVMPLLRNKYDGFDVLVSGDPSGANRSQNDERTCADIFVKCGFKRNQLRLKENSNNPIARQGATDTFLSLLTENGPGYLLDPRLVYLKRGMRGGYHYAINKKGVAADSPEKNIFSHICEGGQYADMYFKNGGNTRASEERKKQLQALIAQTRQHAGIYTGT